MKQAIIASAMIISMPALSRGHDAPGAVAVLSSKTHPARHEKLCSDQSFPLSSWTDLNAPAKNASASKTVLELQTYGTGDVAEEITVYGKRHRHEEEQRSEDAPITIGPATISGSQAHDGSFSGMTVTAAVPIAECQGLTLHSNLSGAALEQLRSSKQRSFDAGRDLLLDQAADVPLPGSRAGDAIATSATIARVGLELHQSPGGVAAVENDPPTTCLQKPHVLRNVSLWSIS